MTKLHMRSNGKKVIEICNHFFLYYCFVIIIIKLFQFHLLKKLKFLL